jgi:hypothetical protein
MASAILIVDLGATLIITLLQNFNDHWGKTSVHVAIRPQINVAFKLLLSEKNL